MTPPDQKPAGATCSSSEPHVHAPYGFVINEFGDSVPAASAEEAARGVRQAAPAEGEPQGTQAPQLEPEDQRRERMREQFEEAATVLGFTARSLATGPDGRYIMEKSQDAWTLWQESAKRAAREAEEKAERRLEVLRGQNELLRMELEDTRQALAREIPVAPARRDWVDCPVCGESDMRREADEEDNVIITCTNHECGSNGGSNWSAFPLQPDIHATGVVNPDVQLSPAEVTSEKQLLTQAWKAYHGDQPADFSEAFLFAAGWLAGRSAKLLVK
jgi:rubrerythrin